MSVPEIGGERPAPPAPPGGGALGSGSFTDVFIQRPVLAAVLSLLLLLLGTMGYRLLAVRETPDVQSPVVTVTTTWPGADPAIVESDVTEVLERELNGIDGVRTLTSTSQDGSSQIIVEFTLERDLEDAANDVRSRVSRVRRKLPSDIDDPTIEKADASAQPVLFLRLAGSDRSMLAITEIADTIVRDRIENVEGVSGLDLYGAQVYAMRIELDRGRMAERGVTLADVEAALQAGNVDLPAGRIEGTATQLTLHVQGGLTTPEEFGGLVIRADCTSRVSLRDLASIRLGAENENTAGRADGEPAVSVAVTPQAKANIIDVSDEIRRRLPSIQEDLPPGLTLNIVYDRADAVRASIHDVEITLLVAFSLVVAVIFLFLRDWRSTLVPAVAIPVSIVGTFLVLWAAGFTINVFTLFGLVLAIGLVVDDAIVVLENVVRRIEEGEPVMEAAIHGTRQIAFAVIATTVSLVAVFLPVIFTGGTTGRLFLEFGTTVASSVAISMVVALTLTPMLCSRMLRPGKGVPHTGAPAQPRGVARLFAFTLDRVMRWPVLVLPVLVVALLGVAAGFSYLPREFFPTEDRNIFMIRTVAPEGASFSWMDARMKEVEQQVMPLVPERQIMLSRVATGPGGTAAGTNTGMIIFALSPRTQRERSQQEIIQGLKGSLATVTAFRTVPIQFPTVGRGFSPPLQFVLQNADFNALAAELPKFLAAMRTIPGLSSVNEDLHLDRPELWLHVDRDGASALGVPIRDVARTLQVLTSGLQVSTFKRGVRQYRVIASLSPGERASPMDVGAIHLRGRGGEMIPLASLIQTDERAGTAARYHYNRAPSATISANLDGITLGEGIARVQALARDELPEGFRTALAGESRDFADSSSSLVQMFLLALALVYLLLAAQFDSFLAPISIMLSVPLALAGAFAALTVSGMTLSFFGQVGLILLVGLVTKNGILIVEYARQLQHEGLDPWQAASRAAQLRFRPILMTSVATIGGAIPIAVGLSGASRASLGVAVVGGMITATLMTLYVTPVVYAALASIGSRRATRGAAAAVLAMVLGSHPARAEAPLTLADALQLATTRSLSVQAGATVVDAASASVAAARANLLPVVQGQAGVDWGNLHTSGSLEPSVSATGDLRVDAPILQPGAIASLRAARLGLDAATASQEATVEGVLADVAARFVTLQQARQAVSAAEARRTEAEHLATVARDRVELGAAPRIDQTRADLALQTEQVRLLSAQTAAARASVRLAQALGLPVDATIELVPAVPILPPDALPDDAALDAAIVDARSRFPDVVAARAQRDATVADRRAAQLAAAPTLAAYGQVGVGSDLAGTTLAPVAGVGASATVPIWAGGARAADVRAARASEAAGAIALAEAERAVEADLRVALRTVRDAGSALPLADAGVALAADQLERAEARYSAGVGDNLEVVSAQAAVAAAEQARVDALAAYNLAVLGWYQARGELRDLATGG